MRDARAYCPVDGSALFDWDTLKFSDPARPWEASYRCAGAGVGTPHVVVVLQQADATTTRVLVLPVPGVEPPRPSSQPPSGDGGVSPAPLAPRPRKLAPFVVKPR